MKTARHSLRATSRRRGEHGLTLVELLLGLALLVLLAAFTTNGLVLARRAFIVDRSADLDEATDSATQTLSGLLASAVPVAIKEGTGVQKVLFDGGPEHVSFIGLGEGHSLRGGWHAIDIYLDSAKLLVQVKPTRGESASAEPEEVSRRVVLLTGVKSTDFSFFGSLEKNAKPTWHNEWVKAEALPLQVSVRLEFNRDRSPAIFIVTLHQM